MVKRTGDRIRPRCRTESVPGRSLVVVAEDRPDAHPYSRLLCDYELRWVATVREARVVLSARNWGKAPAHAVCIDATVSDSDAEALLPLIAALSPRPGSIVVRERLSVERLITSYRFGSLAIPQDGDAHTIRGAVAAATVRPRYQTLVHHLCRQHALSRSECAALRAAADGLGTNQAALRVGCSARTLDTHWQRIFNKTGYRSKQEVLALALRLA